MAEDQLRDIVEAMRARIQAELETQMQALTARHQEEIAKARKDAEQAADAKAEARWSGKVDAVRVELSNRLHAEVAAAKAEAEKRLLADTARTRAEAEHAIAEASARAKRDIEQAVAAERHRSDAELAAEKRRSDERMASLDAQRRQTAAVPPDTLLNAIRAIEGARSLSDALTALGRAASQRAPRVSLFVVNGTRLDLWPVPGVPPIAGGGFDINSADVQLLKSAIRRGTAVLSAPNDPERPVPAFAALPADRAAAAIPLVIGGQTVALLYADEGKDVTPPAAATWSPAVEILARHAATCLAHLTAVRTLQLAQGTNGGAAADRGVADDDQGARRYAKLLVSEIKLYNEGAVRTGREKRDLLQRLSAEIQRARRLFDERVPPSVGARGFYFHQELVETLAGGDPTLLGPEPRP